MKLLKSNLILSSLFSAAALMAGSAQAAENPVQAAYKSTNVKGALINVCKDQTAKGGKLSAAEVSKFCSCQVEAQGKVTEAQNGKFKAQSMRRKAQAL